ncbi:MAG TPA: OsmC family protein [Solirubrobacterales bacterium]|nr:OsmC family protein [Solirubrobacterales bacterium]
MRVVARRREGYIHDVEIEGGTHALVVDEPTVAGGEDAGPSPTRLVAAGLASCIAITMEMYAERNGWDVGAVEVGVDVEYEGFVPTSFSSSIRLPEGLSEEQRERLLAVARKCPVHKLLAHETSVVVADRIEPL